MFTFENNVKASQYKLINTSPKRFVQFEKRTKKTAGYEMIFHPKLM